MKKKFATVLVMCAMVLAMGALFACSSSSSSSSAASQSASATSASASSAAASASAASASATSASAAATLENGTYEVTIKTDSSMFHVNEAYKNKGTLTVENGTMTAHMTLASTRIVNLFVGKAEDAQKDGAAVLPPTVEDVKYSDGTTEQANAFDIPVPALGEPFDVAILGESGKWFDHVVTVSDPQPAQK